MQTSMFKRFQIAVLIVGLLLLNVAVVQAADEPAAGLHPEKAMSPTVGWVTVTPDEAHWYTFNYDYNDDDDTHPAQAIATLQMMSAGDVGFIVQTMDRLGPWIDADDDPGPLGVGTPIFTGNDDDGDGVYDAQTLVWAGSAKASGDYLIIVEGDGLYQLDVEGETVNFKQPSLESAMAFGGTTPAHDMMDDSMEAVAMADDEVLTETFALTIEPAAAAVAAAAGTGVESAIAPTIGWATVEPGESQWYTFNYDYDLGSDDPAEQVTALLEMESAGSVNFIVQTLDRLGPYAFGDDIPGPLGVGSQMYRGNDDDGDGVYNPHMLSWTGSARASGTYYVIVDGEGAYKLTVSGPTVYFPEKSLDGNPAFAMMSK